jgi:hypothetical protein
MNNVFEIWLLGYKFFKENRIEILDFYPITNKIPVFPSPTRRGRASALCARERVNEIALG